MRKQAVREMVTQVETHEAEALVEVDHWVCDCGRDDNTALCGADVTDVPWARFEVATCPLCRLANETTPYCPRCEERWE